MTQRIKEDWKSFRDAVSGKTRKSLKGLIDSGEIVTARPKGGRFHIRIPRINTPHFAHGGNPTDGVGRGQGEPGDTIGKGPPQPGQGNGAGQDEAEGIEVAVDMEDVLEFLQDEWKLPRLKPKPSQTFEEIKLKYTNISVVGPESLRHNRRTIFQAMKRAAASGNANKMIMPPGFQTPIREFSVNNNDKRYRQYREIKLPASNAVVFFARDWSASVGAEQCEIISDMAWWINCFVSRSYKRTERVFIGHDVVAKEVDEEKFYKYRMGGGTTCSSALKYIADQLENRFPPNKWNIYVFYFTDGDNYGDDNKHFINYLRNELGPSKVNRIGIAEILPWSNSLKRHVDNAIIDKELDENIVKTWEIKSSTDRNRQIKEGITHILGDK